MSVKPGRLETGIARGSWRRVLERIELALAVKRELSLSNVLIRKLESLSPLAEDDRAYIANITANVHHIPRDIDIIREGETPSAVHLIVSGFACRYKILPNGNRQIVAYLLPGDLCDLHVFILESMDHSIGAVTDLQLVYISQQTVLDMLNRPAISRALLLGTLVDEATLREWLTNLGQRPAEQRLAHLFCELHMRLSTVGLVRDGAFDLPLTQTELGDTTGLSTVHVNRSLQSLREQGLIVLKSRRLMIPDVGRLRLSCSFRSNYLHLSRSEP